MNTNTHTHTHNLNIQITNNTEYIEYVKSLYKTINSISDKINLLQYIASFMTRKVTTHFTDKFLESELNHISKNLEFDLNTEFTANSVLHIMTKAYSIGGHTKLLELMIQNTSSYFDKQSVLISDYQSQVPETLKNLAEAHGEFILFENLTVIQRAEKLANIASNYQYVILHIHQDDILANLAFGNTNFTRPVIFMNHADHMFWCGISIADLVLDLSEEGSQFSHQIRGANQSKVIRIPIEAKNNFITKTEARKHLNLDENKKIILSIASEYKYGKEHKDISIFINMALNIVNTISNCEFLLIGPSIKNRSWENAQVISNGKIKPLGTKQRELLPYYTAASDLYIESFPFGSATAFLDTALYDINMLSLKTPIFTQDIMKTNNLLTHSVDELQERAIQILTMEDSEHNHIDLSVHLKKAWTENFVSIIESSVPKTHHIYDNHKTMEANIDYLNNIYIAIGQDSILTKTYSILPFILKLKLAIAMKKYKIVITPKDLSKLIRKTITF